MAKPCQSDHEFSKTVRDLTDTDNNDDALIVVSEALKKPKTADAEAVGTGEQ